MAEFQYNNHIHSSTQQTPFFLDRDDNPAWALNPLTIPTGTVNDSRIGCSPRSQRQVRTCKAQDDMTAITIAIGSST